MAKKSALPDRLRCLVRERGQGRCEDCLIHEADHVLAEKHGDPPRLRTSHGPVCLVAASKARDLASVDRTLNNVVFLFHPREQRWHRHVGLNGALSEGMTTSGRATVALLHFTDAQRVASRLGLIDLGHSPAREESSMTEGFGSISRLTRNASMENASSMGSNHASALPLLRTTGWRRILETHPKDVARQLKWA